ncbi:MAG: hypothetical protein ACRDCC_10315, partial [Culicoidibacterales bacterium]
TLSVLSKLLQWQGFWLWGNIIVLFAACALVVSGLFSLPWFINLHQNPKLKRLATWCLVLSCLTVTNFQIMTMLLTSGHHLGFIFLFTFFIALLSLFFLVSSVTRKNS